MALFPAFADKITESKDEDQKTTEQQWLENSSYGIQNAFTSEVSSDSSFEEEEEEEKPKSSVHSYLYPPRKKDEEIYFKDCERNKKFYSLDSLARIGPRYKLSNFRMGIFKAKKRYKRFTRYYLKNIDRLKEEDNNELNKIDDEARKQKVLEFNNKLAKFPHDIETWIQYASLQDEIESLSLKGKHAVNQKKLSILDKALAANNSSIELLEMKLQAMFNILPIDQYVEEIEKMLKKDSKNCFLWMKLVKTLQTSCALFSVPRVLNEYKKCYFIFRKTSDELMLKLLHQCLIFLRHAGFWEQLWEIIKLSLRLNLALPSEVFRDIKVMDEKELINLEEMIIMSKLPLSQLWLRVELLRESSLWTSVDPTKVDVSLVGDENRLVSIEDISDFIHPLTSNSLNFQLVVMFITCLKVPLLPSRHCTLEDFFMQDCSWHIDTLESVLPFVYPTIWTDQKKMFDGNFIKNLLQGNLMSGPQFLTFHPAREFYLDFIRSVFHTVAQRLTTVQKSSLLVWWLRFERLLIFVSRNDPLIEQEKEKKKVKSLLKNFLKQAENRNNFYFYQEYALIEYELGSLDSCVQTCKKIIQSSASLTVQEARELISLYRTTFEVLLDNDKNDLFQEIITYLKSFLCQNFNYGSNMSTLEMLYNEILKFLAVEASDESSDTAFLPNYFCDLISCYAYLSLFDKNENIENTLELFDKCLVHVSECTHLAERFLEAKVAFLQFYRRKTERIVEILQNTVESGLKKFPNSFFLLTVNALIESEKPYWKMNLKTQNTWSIIAKCLVGRAQISQLQNLGLEEAHKAMTNKMLSFHKTVSEIHTCPLTWKLYVLLIQEQDLREKKGEDIYYKAISDCPWVRGVYLNAAQIAPQVVPQIQDLIKEKDLRIYITPQELDVLRE